MPNDGSGHPESQSERVELALRQIGRDVAPAVAQASHAAAADLVARVYKHKQDALVLSRMRNSMQMYRPAMFKRLSGIARMAAAQPVPSPEAAALFDLESFLTSSGYVVTEKVGRGVCRVQNRDGATEILKFSFASRDCLLRELRVLYATTGMPGICQAAITPAGHLGVLHTQGQPAAILLAADPGISLTRALSHPEWIIRAGACAASLSGVVAHLHRAGFLHGDLHPDNILIEPHTSSITLCDLGMAAFVEEGLRKYGRRGWKAPEVARVTAANMWSAPFLQRERGRFLDIWALSVTLLCMATSQPMLWSGADEQDRRLAGLSIDIGRDQDLWGRRGRLGTGPHAPRGCVIWYAAALGLQHNPKRRVDAARISQILCGQDNAL